MCVVRDLRLALYSVTKLNADFVDVVACCGFVCLRAYILQCSDNTVGSDCL